ncbi:MAG TPA: [protein-PII] uridylyltransferase [Acidimicrobiales bacterium]
MTIARVRDQLAADDTLVGRQLCRVWSAEVDRWLAELLEVAAEPDLAGVALAAVGGYGREELSLQSDIDVILLHAGRDDIGAVADRVWYPIWDEGMKLGHSVRTVKEALALGADDLDTATSLLDLRHLGGDRSLTDELAAKAELQWRKRAKRWLGTMAERVKARHRKAGDVAFLLEPDLKEGHGGLRDVQGLRWAQAARTILWEGDHEALDAAYDLLLGVRVELHRRTGRPGDKLLLQDQDAVAHALGYEHADDMMRDVAVAARTIAWTSDDAWARIEASLAGPLGRIRRERKLAPGLVLRDGEVHITDDADVAGDPALALRAAAAAARAQTQLDRSSLARLAAEAAAPPEPWPDEVRAAFVDLLLAGPPAIILLEALDQQGVWERYLPEWPTVRSKPQRNAYHRFTVDRHLWETAAEAAGLAGRVRRPDLLVLGALLHDLGKGEPGDHTANGIRLLETIGPRMGLGADDAAVLVDLCRHHLLLPDVATRRDLADPATINGVARSVRSVEVLELLAALTEADSLATGPAAWSEWKAALVRQLVARVGRALEGDAPAPIGPSFPSAAERELLAAGESRIVTDGDRLTVVAPDRHGLFSRVAGVLSLHGLDVLDAAATTEHGWALQVYRVQSSFGPTFSWSRVVEDLERGLAGQLAIRARLAERAQVYGSRRRPVVGAVEPEVRFDLEASDEATVVEVHAPDAVGLLYRVTQALADLDLDIVSAKVQTLGPQVVDSFYVRGRDGRKVADPVVLAEVERALLHALDAPS